MENWTIVTNLLQIWGLTFFFVLLSFSFYLITKKMSVIDIFWGLFHLAQLSFTLFVVSPGFTPASIMFFSLIYLWGFRLAIYLYARSKGKPDDQRYIKLSTAWSGNLALNVLTRIFGGQFCILLFTSLSFTLTAISSSEMTLNISFFAGYAIAIFGLLYESIADFQLLSFKSKPVSDKKVMDLGLWSFSRHPNYFGEIIFWWGIWAISTQGPYWFVGLISPLTVTYLLTRFSGIPMLEERYRDNPEYLEYIQTTNVLIPGRKK